MQPIARKHAKRNSYVFVTRQTSRGTRDYAGWGFVGVVCSKDQGMRVNLNRGTKRVMSFALVLIFPQINIFIPILHGEGYMVTLCIVDSCT